MRDIKTSNKTTNPFFNPLMNCHHLVRHCVVANIVDTTVAAVDQVASLDTDHGSVVDLA